MALTEEEARAKQAETARRMAEDGLTTEEGVQDDYFGTDEVHRAYLPDGKSYIEHRTLSHGLRKRYLNKTNRDLSINRATGDAKISMKPGDEKDELLKTAICGWNLVRAGQPVPFSPGALESWLQNANPKIVDIVEKEIRKANPWLMAEMSSEDIQREIDSLQEMLEVKKKEEEGKES